MIVSSASPKDTQHTLALSCSALDGVGFSSCVPFSPSREEPHCTPTTFPCKNTPNLPFQSNVQLEEVGSHTALFFGKEKTGSFYLHRKDSEELPSGEKKQKMVQKQKGFHSPQYCWFARTNSVLWQWADDDVALRDCPQPKLLLFAQRKVPFIKKNPKHQSTS